MVKYFVLSQYEPILLLRENEMYYVGNVLCRQWIFRAKSKINVITSEGCYKCIKWHKSYTFLNAKKYIQALCVGGQINSYRTAYKNVRFTSHKT